MGLRDSIKADAVSIFLRTSEFAELIPYRFGSGGSREVAATVDRDPPEVYNAAGDVVMPKFIIRIHNDSDTGVLPSEVDTGGDRVDLLKEFGGTVTETVGVISVLSQDMGMVTLALR